MALTRVEYPGQGGKPLLIAHGLFGSARNWGAAAKRLSAGRPVVAVDMRNHANSPWMPTNSYPDMAADLVAETEPGGDALGHSMGGKATMVAALAHPDHFRRIVVADIAPVAYNRTQAHLIAAMRAVDLGQVETRGDADRLLAVHVADDGVRAFLLQSLDVKEKRWRMNLDVLDAEMPKIMGFPEVSGSFPGPALFLTGGDSDYVRREDRDRIKALFPKARFAKLPGAGHWLHADKPREFVETVAAFLDA